MSRGTPVRTLRVPDELWTAAKARAERDHTTLPEVVRTMLTTYANNNTPTEEAK